MLFASKSKYHDEKSKSENKSQIKGYDKKTVKSPSYTDSNGPQKSLKSPKQSVSKTSQNKGENVRDKKSSSKTDLRTGVKKVDERKSSGKSSKTGSPVDKTDSKLSSTMKRKAKPSTDKSEDKFVKKGHEKDVQSVTKSSRLVKGGDSEKRIREKDIHLDIERARKKQRIEAQLEDMEEFPEAKMDVDSESESEKVEDIRYTYVYKIYLLLSFTYLCYKDKLYDEITII